MRSAAVPVALAERLGESGSAALAEMFDANNRACADAVMTQSAERFERRLVEETSKLRVEMAQMGALLRQEMAELRGSLRQEMAELRGSLRQEIVELRGDLREDIAAGRFELLKWAFLFWVGQVVSVVGLVGLMLRTMPPR
jgi:hypothetical protein